MLVLQDGTMDACLSNAKQERIDFIEKSKVEFARIVQSYCESNNIEIKSVIYVHAVQGITESLFLSAYDGEDPEITDDMTIGDARKIMQGDYEKPKLLTYMGESGSGGRMFILPDEALTRDLKHYLLRYTVLTGQIQAFNNIKSRLTFRFEL